MGLSTMSTCSGGGPAPAPPNPNPRNFEILSAEAYGHHVVALVTYPDCTTYEGRKLLLYRDTTVERVRAAEELDPHFCDKPGHLAPFARFEPTEDGFVAAIIVAARILR